MSLNEKIQEEEAKLDPKGLEAAQEKPEEPVKPEPIVAPKELDESVYAAFEADIPGSSTGLKRIVDQEKKARDEARLMAQEADRILEDARKKALLIEEQAKASEKNELKRMAARLVEEGEMTPEWRDEYLKKKGVAFQPTIDDIAEVVARQTEEVYKRLREEEAAKQTQKATDAQRAKIAAAVTAVISADPSKDTDDAVYLLKTSFKKNPNQTLEQATEDVVKQLKPQPKEPEKAPPIEDIEAEKEGIFGKMFRK